MSTDQRTKAGDCTCLVGPTSSDSIALNSSGPINNMVSGRNRKPVRATSDNSTLPSPHRTQHRPHYFPSCTRSPPSSTFNYDGTTESLLPHRYSLSIYAYPRPPSPQLYHMVHSPTAQCSSRAAALVSVHQMLATMDSSMKWIVSVGGDNLARACRTQVRHLSFT